MNINFTIGLNVLEFLCHFGAMVCFVFTGVLATLEAESLTGKDRNGLESTVLFIAGITLTTIGANL